MSGKTMSGLCTPCNPDQLADGHMCTSSDGKGGYFCESCGVVMTWLQDSEHGRRELAARRQERDDRYKKGKS